MPGYKKPMMGHKKPKMAHGKKPKMGHKPKMAHGDKPKMAHGDKPKMAHAKKPQFNAKLKKAAAEGKLDNNPSFKAAVEKAKPKMYHKKPKMGHEPKMYNKKPFMMKPGSKQVDSPSSFKSNEPAMLFKMGMSGVKIKSPAISDTKEFSSAGYSAGDHREFSKRSGKPIRYSFQGGYNQDEAVTKDNIPVETVVSKITGKSYDDVGGRFTREGSTERHKRVEGFKDKFKEISKKKFGLNMPSMYGKPKMAHGKKPKMYGSKPKMYGKKK